MKSSFGSTYPIINDYKKLNMTAKISSHEILSNEESFLGSKYVIYNVEIFTFYKNWSVKKRYSNFEDLYKIIQTKYKNIDLSEFPPKRLFKNSEATIQERKIKFTNFLNSLFKHLNVCSCVEILNFIEVENELLLLLMKNCTMIESNTRIAIERRKTMKEGNLERKKRKSKSYENLISHFGQNYYSSFLEYKKNDLDSNDDKSANMMLIEEFLRNLEFKFENKCEMVKTFEKFLKSNNSWPLFRREEISKLLFGDAQSDSLSEYSISSENSSNSKFFLKGLLYHIGNIEQNMIGAEACLEFLSKLLDHEFNPDCDSFIYILRTSNIQNYQSMRLNQYIRSNKNKLVITAFRVLKVLVNDERHLTVKLKKIIHDDAICEKFITWFNDNQ